ncbi:hypothetical protein HanRHA438_Chr10g0455771 [Helianthus annuus]|nr:hypothetical protein HanRHA438_Chr10g0455771 [Helianthus annuus]
MMHRHLCSSQPLSPTFYLDLRPPNTLPMLPPSFLTVEHETSPVIVTFTGTPLSDCRNQPQPLTTMSHHPCTLLRTIIVGQNKVRFKKHKPN